MEITKEFKNTLLKRQEIKGVVTAASNPGYPYVLAEIAKKTGKQENLIVIKKVHNKFGSNNFLVEAYIYETQEEKQTIEPKPKTKKGDKT